MRKQGPTTQRRGDPRSPFGPRTPPRYTALAVVLLVLLAVATLSMTTLPPASPRAASSSAGATPAPRFSPGGSSDPNVTLSAYQGLVGSPLDATGSGFVSGDTLGLTFGTVTISGCLTGGLTPDVSGSFSCIFLVPTLTASELYVVDATDGTSPDTGLANYTIDPPTLSPVPTAGAVGSSVTVSGAGYSPDNALTLNFGPKGISSCTSGSLVTNGTGVLNGCTFSVPLVPQGTEEITASDGVNSGQTDYTVSSSTLALTPDFGNVSESVEATGSGFGGDVVLTLTFAGTSVTVCTSGSLTTTSGGDLLDCTFPVPPAPAGAETVIASDGTNPAQATFTIHPTLTLDPDSGAVGTTTAALGTGFAGSETVSVTWNSTTTLCSNKTGGSGGFFCTLVPIPVTTEGSHTLTATDGTNSATAAFDVVPALTLSPSAGINGTSVDLIGTGLAAGATYTYCIQTLPAACSSGNPTFVTVSDGSSPSGTALIVPAEDPGSYFVDVSLDGTYVTDAAFTLTSASLVLDPVAGPGGTVVGFSGSGYLADTNYTYCFQMEPVACVGTPETLTANATGDIPVGLSITVPDEQGGAYFVDLSNNAVLVSAAQFTLESEFTLTPAQGVVGANITVQGVGFTGLAAYAVLWNSTLPLCLGTAGADGSFACTFDVPNVPGGDVPVWAQQQDTLLVAVEFQVLPDAVLTPSTGPVGTAVTLVATGFSALTAGATSDWNATTTLCTNTTDVNGSFSCGFTVPAAPAGAQTLTVSQLLVSVSPSFLVVPSFYLSPNSGPVGTSVSVVGAGFDAAAPFSVLWAGTLTLCSATTSSLGAATCVFVVPSALFGTVSVEVLEGTYAPSENFTVGAGITVSPTSGVIGTGAIVTGTGFDPSAGYTVSWNGGLLLCGGETNVSGDLTCSFTIPSGPGGAHPITALEGSHLATVDIIAYPYVLLVISADTVGSAVNVTGVGFGITSPYSLAWNSTTTLCSGTTSAAGEFNCTFAIPVAPGGVANITASGSGLNATVALTLVPSLVLSPASGSAGTSVQATGYGFGAGVAYAVIWSASATLCAGTTNSNGAFVCTFVVPASGPGSYTITASGAASTPSGTFAVNSTTSVTTHKALLTWWEEVGAIVGAFVLFFLVALLVLRRRRARVRSGAVRPSEGDAGAGEGAANPAMDIDDLMARLERMSVELYNKRPEELAQEEPGAPDSSVPAGPKGDAGPKP